MYITQETASGDEQLAADPVPNVKWNGRRVRGVLQVVNSPPNRAKLALLVWAVIFPLLTLLLIALSPLVGSAPLPVRTGTATAILVPIVVIWIIPAITKRFSGWLSVES